MKVDIDISGNMNDLYRDSVVAFASKDGTLSNTVFLKGKLKRIIYNKYKNRIKDIKEQIHCIMIYYCIKDYLKIISRMKICPDVSPNKIHRYLDIYFADLPQFLKVKKRIKPVKHSSQAHKAAYRTFKKRLKPNLILNKEMITSCLVK